MVAAGPHYDRAGKRSGETGVPFKCVVNIRRRVNVRDNSMPGAEAGRNVRPGRMGVNKKWPLATRRCRRVSRSLSTPSPLPSALFGPSNPRFVRRFISARLQLPVG